MPYIGSRSKRNQKRIEFDDGAFVVLRRPSLREAEGLTDVDKDDVAGSAKKSLELLATLIVEWNLCNESEELVDIRDTDAVVSAIQDLPMDVATQLFEALTSSIKGVGASDKTAQRFQDPGEGSAEGEPAQ